MRLLWGDMAKLFSLSPFLPQISVLSTARSIIYDSWCSWSSQVPGVHLYSNTVVHEILPLVRGIGLRTSRQVGHVTRLVCFPSGSVAADRHSWHRHIIVYSRTMCSVAAIEEAHQLHSKESNDLVQSRAINSQVPFQRRETKLNPPLFISFGIHRIRSSQ